MRARAHGFLVAVGVVACGSFRDTAQPANDAGGGSGPASSSTSSTGPDGASSSSDGAASGTKSDGGVIGPPGDSGGNPPWDASVTPNGACRPLELPCLAADPNVIDVTSAAAFASAVASAKAGDTVQLHGLILSRNVTLNLITLRGCAGAQIQGQVGFLGTGGSVEGFVVTGGVKIPGISGAFAFRQNLFMANTSTNAIDVNASNPTLGCAIDVTVDGNWFEGRTNGVVIGTSGQYNLYPNTAHVSITNNIFTSVATAVSLSQGLPSNPLKGEVSHNTFYDFTRALQLSGMTSPLMTSGNLFVKGTQAINASSPFEARYSLEWLTTRSSSPSAAPLVLGDPAFVDPANADFRLGTGSRAIDVIPNGVAVPNPDYYGCPRPQAVVSAEAKADVGALEAQP